MIGKNDIMMMGIKRKKPIVGRYEFLCSFFYA